MDIFGGWIFSLAFVVLVVLVGLLVRSVVRRKGTARVHGAGIPAASIGSPTEAGARRSRGWVGVRGRAPVNLAG
jgi:hypothetical protein